MYRRSGIPWTSKIALKYSVQFVLVSVFLVLMNDILLYRSATSSNCCMFFDNHCFLSIFSLMFPTTSTRLCWSSAHLVQYELDEPSWTWTQIWVQARVPDYSLNWTARSGTIQRGQKCQWCSPPTRRWPSRNWRPYGLKSAFPGRGPYQRACGIYRPSHQRTSVAQGRFLRVSQRRAVAKTRPAAPKMPRAPSAFP